MRQDIMDKPEYITFKSHDYTEDEINTVRSIFKVTDPNDFNGIRPASIIEQSNLMSKLLGGDDSAQNTYFQKYLKYKKKYVQYKNNP